MHDLKDWAKCPDCNEEDNIKVTKHTNKIQGGGTYRDILIRCMTCGKSISP